MVDLVLLEEVDWISGPPDNGGHWPKLRTCDFCCDTAAQDFMKGLSVPRSFYRLLPNGKFPGGETVCSACVPLVDMSSGV